MRCLDTLTLKIHFFYIIQTNTFLADLSDILDETATLMCRHLKELLKDEARTDALSMEHKGAYVDFSRQAVTSETVDVRPLADRRSSSASFFSRNIG